MKKFKSLVLIVIGLLCSVSVSAEDFEVDGIYYNIISESDKTVEVTYRGNHRYSYSNEYSGAVTIPESVTYSGSTYSVTSIGSGAFCECGLTSVEIPNSVTSIGDGAFYKCWNLTSVEIPNSVTSIRGNVFSSCSSLTSLVVAPDNPIYDSREGCNAIVKTSSNELLSGCQFTIIPNGVTSIGDYAFCYCYGLTSMEIPNSVTSIGRSAFDGCSSLTSVVIGNSVSVIDFFAFMNCTSLTSVKIPNSVTHIRDSSFAECTSLTSVELPNDLLYFGSWAFADCTSLTSVKIPNSVTTIEESTFNGCSSLTSIEIPNSVTSIEKNAFRSCTSLTSIEIPNSVTSIGDEAFYKCSGLTSVNIEDLVAWCNIEFGDESANPLCYAEKLYLNGEEVTDIVIPDGVTSIGDYVFYCCSGLTSVEIPNSVTSIGDGAFAYCHGLTTEIPNSVTSIGDRAFCFCFGLTALEIPNSVTSIGDYAFQGCSSLTSVTSYIPANKLFPIDSNTFSSVDKARCILYVSKGAKETYATMEGWNVFENIVEILPGYELTVTDAGYSTLYLDFTAEIPEGVEVYTAKEVDGVWLQMEQVEEVLPANTGVLVKAPAGTYKFAYSNTTAPSIENNLFKGSETDKYINVPSSSSAFVLSMVDGEVGMYLAKLTDGSFLNNANKAYLLIDNNKLGLSDDELDTSVDGAQLSLRFNFGGATDIDKVNTESYSAPVIYDMYGRKVQQIMRPGLYIINGKKVMMK